MICCKKTSPSASHLQIAVASKKTIKDGNTEIHVAEVKVGELLEEIDVVDDMVFEIVVFVMECTDRHDVQDSQEVVSRAKPV